MNKYEILSVLNSIGDVVPLNLSINVSKLKNELETIDQNLWKIYNPSSRTNNRYGLSLTSIDGSDSGVNLTSLIEYNKQHETNYTELSFRTKTKAYYHCESLHPVFNLFGDYIGRSHLLKVDAGGYFPPHRDSPGWACETFRVLVMGPKSVPPFFNFVLEDRILNLQQGRVYFINTRKMHSVFSTTNNTIQLVLNVELCKESVDIILNNLEST